MFLRRKDGRDVRNPAIRYDTESTGPYYPMQSYNGLVTRAANRQAPESDRDYTPREFRRFVAPASGASDVILNNGLQRYTAFGFRVPFVDYLYAAAPIIPGQMRDDYGGKIKRGPGPLEYQNIVRQTAGSQPQAPGGVGQIAGNTLMNPGTS